MLVTVTVTLVPQEDKVVVVTGTLTRPVALSAAVAEVILYPAATVNVKLPLVANVIVPGPGTVTPAVPVPVFAPLKVYESAPIAGVNVPGAVTPDIDTWLVLGYVTDVAVPVNEPDVKLLPADTV